MFLRKTRQLMDFPQERRRRQIRARIFLVISSAPRQRQAVKPTLCKAPAFRTPANRQLVLSRAAVHQHTAVKPRLRQRRAARSAPQRRTTMQGARGPLPQQRLTRPAPRKGASRRVSPRARHWPSCETCWTPSPRAPATWRPLPDTAGCHCGSVRASISLSAPPSLWRASCPVSCAFLVSLFNPPPLCNCTLFSFAVVTLLSERLYIFHESL